MPVSSENSVSKNENYVFSKKTRPTSARPRHSCAPRYAKLGRCLQSPARQKKREQHQVLKEPPDAVWSRAFLAPLPRNTAKQPTGVCVAAPIRL